MCFIIGFIESFWLMTCMMAPWLLFGFLMAGLLSVFLSPDLVYQQVGKPGWKSIIKAAILGVPLPVCSCGVLPICAALKKQGAGRGATASFLISTPQTGVDSFFATYAVLGWAFAIFRPIVAFINGIFGGVLVEEFSSDVSKEEDSEKAEDHYDSSMSIIKRLIKGLFYGFGKLLGDVSSPLLQGLVLAAFIHIFVPKELVNEYLGSDLTAMLAMLVIGIPLYVCSTASIPIAASFILKGISPGAALVFLISGPASNIAAISVISKILGKKGLILYILSVAVSAIVAGIVFNAMNFPIPLLSKMQEHGGEMSLFSQLCAALLLLLIAISKVPRKSSKNSEVKCCCGK